MSAAIETHELTKRYRRVSALTDCTVTVPEGRVSALVGPNGAGQTTLLRMLAGLASPTSGTVCVLGRVVSRLTRRGGIQHGLQLRRSDGMAPCND